MSDMINDSTMAPSPKQALAELESRVSKLESLGYQDLLAERNQLRARVADLEAALTEAEETMTRATRMTGLDHPGPLMRIRAALEGK